MAVGDILLSVIDHTLDDITALNTLHWRVVAEGAGNGSAVLAGVMDTDYSTNILPNLSNLCTYNGVTVQKIYPTPPSRAQFNATNAGVGSAAYDAMPAEVAYTVTTYTALAGRKYRGRLFGTGLPHVFNSGGELSSGNRTTLQNAWELVIRQITSGGWTFYPVVWHRSTNTYTDITDIRVQFPLRCQRRRQTDRGI